MYDGDMKSVNIGTLKNELSAYLRYVREGGEVIVRDRDVPVARILPFRSANISDEDARLAAAGVLKLPEEEMNWEAFWKLPTGDVPREAAIEAAIWAKGER